MKKKRNYFDVTGTKTFIFPLPKNFKPQKLKFTNVKTLTYSQIILPSTTKYESTRED